VEAAFQQYFHRADSHKHLNHSSVFICHGNVIRYFVMRALQLPENAWLRTGIYNASITILEIQPNGKVSLLCMSDAGHMPVQAITSN
jgi:serine/threonine-protein phosphatase PGAM5